MRRRFGVKMASMDWLLDLYQRHFDWRDLTLVMLSPVFGIFIAMEAWRFRKTGVFDLWDSFDSMNSGGSYLVTDLILLVVLVLPAMGWVYDHRLFTVEVTPLRFVGLFLFVEFLYYGFHRGSHRIRWFWCAHVVHHGSEKMNFGTALRQSWFYPIAGNWLFYLPAVWLGFEPRWVLFALSLNLGYQFFVHTTWVDRMPAWFEFVFNTPSHHRAHHGRNPQYIDRNFGGTLIVFDRLFGSFVPEQEPVDYGLEHPFPTHNLFWLNAHEWRAMFRDMAREKTWGLRLAHLWRPPEWRRHGNGFQG
ncbi:sterol desaturase family protein [Pelomonas aquatica]|jgi:sterol desaturase/sphingolipid hydroxylase (fatty acid hydroxylase superfamily)|uniref:Sterol desaturase family protein n=2 Tax=Pelomonas aquatica TaxID=431058 RepID=A0A9X4R3E5_9BURK|nr:sterol desaturase family protein [Pelomonas aquatica]